MSGIEWREQRILVPGGAGFLGSHVVARLMRKEVAELVVPRSAECDLTVQGNVAGVFASARPTMVIHLAARVGGIGANRENPGTFYYDNAMMGLLLIEQARRSEVAKFVGIGTICAYPKFTAVPFRETDLWNGYPEETNAPYGIAKKAMLVQLQAYRQQFGFNGIYLLPVNLYGPRDNFDPRSSHVIPALIRRLTEAAARGAERVDVWGTGRATREFLYVDDCAEAIVLAAERYDGSEPVNVGAGFEISIRELAGKIAGLCEFRGELAWDASKPDGQPRRSLDTRRAEELFGFRARTKFDDGLARTVAWYREAVDSGSLAAAGV